MCSLIPALHARLFETPIRAVLRPYKSSGQERPWLTKLLVSLSSYKRFVYPLNHAQRESWSFLVFLATHLSALATLSSSTVYSHYYPLRLQNLIAISSQHY